MSVACILFEEGRVLLIQRRDIPVWVLPGGGIEVGETPEEAACREMEEETGIRVEIIRKVAEYTPRNKLARFTHFFEMKKIGGTPTKGSETRDVAFFSLDHLPKHLPPPYEHWINDAVAHHTDILKKEIEGVGYRTLLKLLLKHPVLVGRFLLTKMGIHINT